MFTSIWAAFDGKALSTSLEKERRDNIAAFVSSVSECVGVYARRLYTGMSKYALEPTEQVNSALPLVRSQWSRLWSETLQGHFRLPPPTLGTLLGKGLLRLHGVGTGIKSIYHIVYRR